MAFFKVRPIITQGDPAVGCVAVLSKTQYLVNLQNCLQVWETTMGERTSVCRQYQHLRCTVYNTAAGMNLTLPYTPEALYNAFNNPGTELSEKDMYNEWKSVPNQPKV